MVLIKDNHITAAGGVEKILARAKKKVKNRKIEIEVSNKKEALEAAKFRPDIIMLDNFTIKNAKDTVKKLKISGFRGKIELSGGINLKNLRQYANCGADFISMGEITKRAKMIDFHLTVKK
jgi:nicotinate-nucleotide pyrophosphorylase (carboxylating)